MTEAQIEAKAERMMDALDRLYLNGQITEASYKAQVVELDEWVRTRPFLPNRR